jgi:hypothetical protein
MILPFGLSKEAAVTSKVAAVTEVDEPIMPGSLKLTGNGG